MQTIKLFPYESLQERSSKAFLINLFGISSSSFYELLAASQWLTDFEEDYPSANGQPIKRAKLSKYQAWVLFHLNRYRLELGVSLRQLQTLLSNSESELSLSLSKQSYITQQTNELTATSK